MVFSTYEILDKIIQYDQSNETPLFCSMKHEIFLELQGVQKSTFKIEPRPIKVHRMFSLRGAEEGGARETMVTNE